LDAAAWPLPPVFAWLRRAGNIEPSEMARTFNCGLGMVLVVAREHAAAVVAELGDDAYVVGELTAYDSSEQRVTVKNSSHW
ncbi:hypothetical protein IWW47_004611, partial [Coemansia sp. RSA 2052]